MLERLEQILACPSCKGSVTVEVTAYYDKRIMEGFVECGICKEKYFIKEGVFYLKKDVDFEEVGTTEPWNLEKFENRYEGLGTYRNSWEWGRLTGIPDAVTSFMYPKVKGRILEWLSIDNNDVVLDVGCGVGYFIFEIINKSASSNNLFIGIDVASSNIKLLNKRCYEEKNINVIGIVADSLSLPIRNDSINWAVCSEVLEHIYKPGEALKEISRVLTRGGHFLISTPLKEGVELWKIIAKPFKLILLRNRKKKTQERVRGYDSPITSKEIVVNLDKAELDILDFQYNVILPPEEHFKRMPGFVVNIVVRICQLMEKNFKKLFKPLATHAVVKCKK